MLRKVKLSLGRDTVEKTVNFREGLDEKGLQLRACKRYSAIINMGGTVTVLS